MSLSEEEGEWLFGEPFFFPSELPWPWWEQIFLGLGGLRWSFLGLFLLFWGAYFGNGFDQFGIQWMIDCDSSSATSKVKMALADVKQSVEALEHIVNLKDEHAAPHKKPKTGNGE